jgi:hypothetical protein
MLTLTHCTTSQCIGSTTTLMQVPQNVVNCFTLDPLSMLPGCVDLRCMQCLIYVANWGFHNWSSHLALSRSHTVCQTCHSSSGTLGECCKCNIANFRWVPNLQWWNAHTCICSNHWDCSVRAFNPNSTHDGLVLNKQQVSVAD